MAVFHYLPNGWVDRTGREPFPKEYECKNCHDFFTEDEMTKHCGSIVCTQCNDDLNIDHPDLEQFVD